MSKAVESHTKESFKRRYMTSITVQIVIALVFVFGLYLFNKKDPVKIERHRISSNYKPSILNTPDLEQIIEWSSKLGLSSQQQEKLLALDVEQKQSIQSIDKQISDSISSFKQTIEQKNKNKERLSLSAVSKMATPATNLGREKRQLLDRFSKKAFAVLTKGQQLKAKKIFKIEMAKGSGGSVFE